MDPKTFSIHASKPTIESLLGIKYIFLKDFFTITSISDESIFKHGELRIGHDVVQVNGTSVTGQSKESLRTLLGSLGESVVFVVKSSWIAKVELKTDEPQKVPSQRTSDGPEKKVSKGRLATNYSKNKVPKFLEGRNVPKGIWNKIYIALDTQLLTVLTENYKIDELWKKEIAAYTSIQAAKSVDVFATGVKHQKAMLEILHATALVFNSSTTVANNLLLWLNVVLQPYGLFCQLSLETVTLPGFSNKHLHETFDVVIIKGIEFTPIDFVAALDGFDISVHQSEDGSVLTEYEEIDTTRWC